MTDERLYKIGDVADLLATSVRTLRYYEEMGLVRPLRSQGGSRLYTRRHIDRLRAALHLTQNGHAIEIVQALATAREQSRTGDESQAAVISRLDDIVGHLETAMADLGRLREEMLQARDIVSRCAGCANPPNSQGCPECPVRHRLRDVGILNLVWDQD